MRAERYFEDRSQASFVEAVGRGDLKRARVLLEAGASVEAVGREGMTALHWAIIKQNLAGLRFLLEQGASPGTLTQWVDGNGQQHAASVIELAAIMADSGYLRALLDAGADPDQVIDDSQQTAIYHALTHRRMDNVKLLVERGASLDRRSRSGKTPISHAVGMRSYAAALLLLRLGADPSIKNEFGYSAVETTRQFGSAGTVVGSVDEAAYPQFVEELKARGYWTD